MNIKASNMIKSDEDFEEVDTLAEAAGFEFYYAADFFWNAPSQSPSTDIGCYDHVLGSISAGIWRGPKIKVGVRSCNSTNGLIRPPYVSPA